MVTGAAEASVVNPNLREFLDQLYADQLSRIYMGPSGERVMLSLAYGRNQNRDLQVHKPEVCYVAQGFQLQEMSKVDLHTPFGTLPAMHLVTRMGSRNEPVTYWIRVGDKVIRGWLEQNINRIQIGLKGQIPDGLLVRVSTVQPDTQQAFDIQEKFLSDMLQAVSPEHRHMFIGQLSATDRS
jgi:EpsI family protein